MFKDNYQELANAIVLNAVDSYRVNYAKALRLRTKRKRDWEIEKEVRECELFFLSDWFEALCSLDGCKLLKTLQEEIKSNLMIKNKGNRGYKE